MQLKWSRLYILPELPERDQIQKLVKQSTPQSTSTNGSANQQGKQQTLPTTLLCPTVALLFVFVPISQNFQPELSLYPQFYIRQQKISYKLISTEKGEGYLLKYLQLDDCGIYGKTINLVLTVKYAETEGETVDRQTSDHRGIKNINQLNKLLAQGKFVLWGQKIMATYRRQVIVKQPLQITSRYSAKGYIWLHFKNSSQDSMKQQLKDVNTVRLVKVELQNWMVKNNDNLKLFQSKNALNMNEDKIKISNQSQKQKKYEGFVLKANQQVGVFCTICQNLGKFQVPLVIQYYINSNPYKFKMIKNLVLG